MKILAVDDNLDITELLDMVLGALGHQIEVCNDGKTGLGKMASSKYDVILLDLAMPGFSGFELIDQLHADGNIKNQNIVVFTASSMDEDKKNDLLNKGVKKILEKPLEIEALEKSILEFKKDD